jgi:hypothetical protein
VVNRTGTAVRLQGGELRAKRLNLGGNTQALQMTGGRLVTRLIPHSFVQDGGIIAFEPSSEVGEYTGNGGALEFNLRPTIAASGSVTFHGYAITLANTRLDLVVDGGFEPALGTTFPLIKRDHSGSITNGVFAAINGIEISPDRVFAVLYNTNATTRVAARVAVPGDIDLDGAVDFDDLLKLAQQYGSTSGKTWITGEITGDGAVNFDDLLVLAQHYSGSALMPPNAGLSSAFQTDWAIARSLVPEPGILCAATAGFSRRRRRN